MNTDSSPHMAAHARPAAAAPAGPNALEAAAAREYAELLETPPSAQELEAQMHSLCVRIYGGASREALRSLLVEVSMLSCRPLQPQQRDTVASLRSEILMRLQMLQGIRLSADAAAPANPPAAGDDHQDRGPR